MALEPSHSASDGAGGTGKVVTKKKKLLTAFEADKQHVLHIDVADFPLKDCFASGTDACFLVTAEAAALAAIDARLLSVPLLLVDLQKATTLAAQMRAIHERKGVFKRVFAQANNVTDDNVGATVHISWPCIEPGVQCMLQLYLLPQFFALRSSLGWIVECLQLVRFVDRSAVQSTVAAVCYAVWTQLEEGPCSSDAVLSDINAAVGGVLSFSCMSALDSHFRWLDSCLHGPDEEAMLYRYLENLNKVFNICAVHIRTADVEEKSTTSEEMKYGQSSATLLKYTECCCEIMRAIMSTLKNRLADDRQLQLLQQQTEWPHMLEMLMESGVDMLASSAMTRDATTSIALGLITVQYMASRGATAEEYASQMLSMITLWLSTDSSAAAAREYAASCGVHSAFTDALTSGAMPPLACCALVRAMLAIYDDAALEMKLENAINHSAHQQLLLHLLQDDGSSSILLGPIYRCFRQFCDATEIVQRFYGLQSLEHWLIRLQSQHASGTLNGQNLLLRHVSDIAALLLQAWCSPFAQVNRIVPSVYRQLLQLLAAVLPPNHCVDKENVWSELLISAFKMPPYHRGRYQSLSYLLPSIGATRMQEVLPDLLQQFIALLADRDIAAAVSGFLGELLESLVHLSTPMDIRMVWSNDVAAALCCSDAKMRINTINYFLPELVRADPTCVPHLLLHIRKRLQLKQCSISAALWGLISLAQLAKLRNLHGQCITSTRGDFSIASDAIHCGEDVSHGITESELHLAASNADIDLRLAALTTATVSIKTTEAVSSSEWSAFKYCLPHCLKGAQSEHRQKLVRAVKALVTRVKESNIVCNRDLPALEKRLVALRQVPDSVQHEVQRSKSSKKKKRNEPISVADCEEQLRVMRVTMDRNAEIVCWIHDSFIENLYPGTCCDREVLTLEVIGAVFDVLQSNDHRAVVSSSHEPIKALGNYFMDAAMVQTVLNLFISNWDRSRVLASKLLLRFPRPLRLLPAPASSSDSAYKTAVELLVLKALNRARSARLRESDSGALLLRDLYLIFVVENQYSFGISEQLNLRIEVLQYHPAAGDPRVSFIRSLCNVWQQSLNDLSDLFNSLSIQQVTAGGCWGSNVTGSAAISVPPKATGPIPVCNGILLAIRYCLQENLASGLFDRCGANVLQIWRSMIQRVFSQSIESLRQSLTVVAEAASDVPFAPLPGAAASGTKGPINSSMAASYVNTNSLLGARAGSAHLDDESTILDASAQRAVVAAWLLVKESVALLAALVEISLSVSSTTQIELLSLADISTVGDVILDALGRLKHMGAISEAQTALQSIATTLLRRSSQDPRLARLPQQWLDHLLRKISFDPAIRSQQQQAFILRRSAGYSFSFLSLLRAEPLNCSPFLLPMAMNALIGTVERISHSDIREEGNSDEEGWKLAVHALNVLRAILSDASLGTDMATYLPRVVELSISGFTSPHWAVRNSSMMVFTAAAQRAVGTDKNDTTGASVPTFFEFKDRFPTLIPSIKGQLDRAVRDHAPDVSLVKNYPETPPTLYPLLLLIAKLRIAVTTPEAVSTSDDSSLAAGFARLAVECCSSRNSLIRHMAAKCLRVVVPIDKIPQQLQALFLDVLQALQRQDPLGQSVVNTLHGQLLSSLELLFSASTFLSDLANRIHTTLANDLLQQMHTMVMPLLLQIADTLKGVNCAVISLVLLQCCEKMHELLSAKTDECSRCVVGLSSGALTEAALCPRSTMLPPYAPLMWKYAAEHFVQYSFGFKYKFLSPIWATANEETDGVISGHDQHQPLSLNEIFGFLRHPCSEVRDGVLCGIMRLLEYCDQDDKEFQEALLQQLFRRVQEEKEADLQMLLMEALLTLADKMPMQSCCLSLQAELSEHGLQTLFNTIVRHSDADGKCTTLKSNGATGLAIELFSWLLQGIFIYDDDGNASSVSLSNESTLQWTLKWLDILKVASQPTCSVSMRLSSARALLQSRLSILPPQIKPRQFSSAAAGIAWDQVLINIWCITLELIQDDDSEVRQNMIEFCSGPAAEALHAHIGSERFHVNETLAMAAIAGRIGKHFLNIMDGFIVRLESTADENKDCPPFDSALDLLESLVWNPMMEIIGDSEITDSVTADMSTTADPSAKIFETEQDNIYCEALCKAEVYQSALDVIVTEFLSVVEVNDDDAYRVRAQRNLRQWVSKKAAPVVERNVSLLRLAADGARMAAEGGASYHHDVYRHLCLSLQLLHRVVWKTVTSKLSPTTKNDLQQQQLYELWNALLDSHSEAICAGNEDTAIWQQKLHPSISKKAIALIECKL